MDWKMWFGIPGAIVSVVTVWGAFGFPTIATGEDINRLNRKQADTAVEIYNNKVQMWVSQAPPPTASPAQLEAWKAQLEQAKSQLNLAEQRKIELSK